MRERVKRWMPPFVFLFYRIIRERMILTCFFLFRLLPIRWNRVVLCNVWGFGDNAKYIALELLKSSKRLELIFITKRPNRQGLPKGICFVKTNSLAAIFALATAKVWVDCNRKESYIRKRKGQYYIQTWHGSISLKKIEGDYRSHLSNEYIKNAKRDSAMTDLYLSNGTLCSEMYRRAFWYTGEILECGSPRLDSFVKPEGNRRKSRWRKQLGLSSETKLAVFAPTYRENRGTAGYQASLQKQDQNAELCSLDFEALASTLKVRFGGDWKIVLRLHPLVSLSVKRKKGFSVVDASEMEDLYEILLEADVLITDYSNTMFEFTLLDRPVFLYAPDQKEYERERGFYFPFSSLPFPKAGSETALHQAILSFSETEYSDDVSRFLNCIHLKEQGNAASQTMDRILDQLH